MNAPHDLTDICEGPEMETVIAFCACGTTHEERTEAAALEAHANHHNQLKGNTMNKIMSIHFEDDSSPALEVAAHRSEVDRDWAHFYDAEGELVASVLSRRIRHITMEAGA